MKSQIFKSLIEIRPVYSMYRRSLSQSDNGNFFKFYSDERKLCDKYKPLEESDYERFLSTRAKRRVPAITRLVTSLSYKMGKDMISLAEGMPNEEIFPFSKLQVEMKNGTRWGLDGQDLAKVLQYVPSQGLPALIASLRQLQADLHRPPELPRDVIVTNGAQHGIYQCFDLLVDEGDPVLMTEYAYTGAHVALKPYAPEILTVPEDENGMISSHLEAILYDRLTKGLKMPKVLYVIPTGNNPSGMVLSDERRNEIYELACKYDFLIVEDDPYMFLNYNEEGVSSFLSRDTCGRVLRLDSLSKVVSAGLRAGWLTAPAPLRHRLELHAQAELLHSCTVSQAILLQLVSERAALGSHLQSARAFYRRRRDALHAALTRAQAGGGGVAQWCKPAAGLFLWLKVVGVEDVYDMVFKTAFDRGLMMVPGQAFQYDSGATCTYVRLTFSKVPLEHMDTAARHLVEIIESEQRRTLDRQQQRFATER